MFYQILPYVRYSTTDSALIVNILSSFFLCRKRVGHLRSFYAANVLAIFVLILGRRRVGQLQQEG